MRSGAWEGVAAPVVGVAEGPVVAGGSVELLPWQVVKVQCSSVNRVVPLPLASKVKVSRPPAPGAGSSPESDARCRRG